LPVKTREISHNHAPRWGLGRFPGLLGDRSFIAPSRTVSHQNDSRLLRFVLRLAGRGVCDVTTLRVAAPAGDRDQKQPDTDFLVRAPDSGD
jgi:hypothetical protein